MRASAAATITLTLPPRLWPITPMRSSSTLDANGALVVAQSIAATTPSRSCAFVGPPRRPPPLSTPTTTKPCEARRSAVMA